MQEKFIKINRPSGVEEYKVLNAFEKDENKYIVLDSKLKDSNQLTITFVSKVNGSSLEYIEGNEWDNLVKQQLISIVKGNSDSIYFEPQEVYEAGEQFGHPLALKDDHIKALVSNYQLPVETKFEEIQQPIEEPMSQVSEMNNQVEPIVQEIPNVENVANSTISVEPVIENNNLNTAIESANEVNTNIEFPFVQESVVTDLPINTNIEPVIQIENPVINEQPEVQVQNSAISEQPEVQVENPVIGEQPEVQVENSVISAQPVIDISVGSDISVPTSDVVPEIEQVQNMTQDNSHDDITSLSNQIYEIINAEKNKIIDAANEEASRIIAQAKEEASKILADANNILANAQAKEQVAEIAFDNAQALKQEDNMISIQDYQPNEGPELKLVA